MDDFKIIKVKHSSSIELVIDNPTELKLIDKGAHGAVFKLPENKCVKIYADERNASLEADAYKKGQGNEIIPNLYEVGNNYIIMEYIEGLSLREYISNKKELSYHLSEKVVSMFDEMKNLKFTRLDTSLRHIIVTSHEKLKIIDLVNAYVEVYSKPSRLLSELKELGLEKQFIEHVKTIDITFFNEWKEFFYNI